jgi:hypothetical protein
LSIPNKSQYVGPPKFELAHFHHTDVEQDSDGKTNGVPPRESEVCGVVKCEPNAENLNAQFDHRIVKDFRVF